MLQPKQGRLTVLPELEARRMGGGSRRSQALGLAIRSTVKPFIGLWSAVPMLPWPYQVVDYVGVALPKVPGTTYERVRLAGCDADLLRTPATEDRVVVYLHGGAFVVGGRHLHRQLMSRISRRTRSAVLAVRYRQLPRHPISAAVEDGLAAYRHVLDSGVPPEKVLIMGDSAGGYLTFAVAVEAERAGLPVPAGLVAMSPFVDFDGTTKLAAPTAETCAMFPRGSFAALSRVEQRAARRAGEDHVFPPPPSRAELGGLPPSLIQASAAEMVYPDAESMAVALTAAGVSCELQVWDHQVHVFQGIGPMLPESAHALSEIARFADRVLAS